MAELIDSSVGGPPLKALALDNFYRLFVSNLNLSDDNNLITDEHVIDQNGGGSSISPIISNRFVFHVGGFSPTKGYLPPSNSRLLSLPKPASPSPLVFYLDLSTSSSSPTFNQGPSLSSPKTCPVVIHMGSKLFAFPDPIQDGIEVLETSYADPKCWTWSPVSPIPMLESLLPPPPPPGSRLRSPGLFIVSYAALNSLNLLFLSLGDSSSRDNPYTKGAVSLNYDYNTDVWRILPGTLPFYGQGQFCDDLCYAFPCGIDRSNPCFVSCYQLHKPSLASLPSSWIELTRYTLPYGPPGQYYPYLQSFSLLHKDFILMMRARSTGWTDREPHSLELDLIHLHKDPQETSILIHSSHLLQYGFQTIVGSYHTTDPDATDEQALSVFGGMTLQTC